jgi:hypothetical protein
MMQLGELQRALQARILEFDDRVEVQLKDAQAADFDSRLNAYVEGYRARLVEALGTTYPVLRQTLGEDEFDRHMRLYIDSTPSRHYSVRYYGENLSAHVTAADALGNNFALAELARWEWTLAEVFDAADDTPLDAATLGTLPPAAWATLSFTPRASLRRMATHSNIVEWWRAANGICARPEALIDAAPAQWLLWRRGVKTLFRSLDPIEAAALDAVCEGATFAAVCERLAQRVEEPDVALRAASLLRGWIGEELIAGHSWQESPH